jgi:hypothetical protein
MPNPNDINIQASLGQTTATGPAAAQLPDVQVERRDPIDAFQAAQQLEGLRRRFGGFGGGGGYTNPTMINGGLRGGRDQMPSNQYGARGGFSHYQGGGGGFGNAPMQAMDPMAGKQKRYVKPMSGFGGFGGMVATTANDPGAVFAGYMDAGDMPQNAQIIGGGGPSPVSQYNPQNMAASQMQGLAQQLQQSQPTQRADWYGLRGRG